MDHPYLSAGYMRLVQIVVVGEWLRVIPPLHGRGAEGDVCEYVTVLCKECGDVCSEGGSCCLGCGFEKC